MTGARQRTIPSWSNYSGSNSLTHRLSSSSYVDPSSLSPQFLKSIGHPMKREHLQERDTTGMAGRTHIVGCHSDRQPRVAIIYAQCCIVLSTLFTYLPIYRYCLFHKMGCAPQGQLFGGSQSNVYASVVPVSRPYSLHMHSPSSPRDHLSIVLFRPGKISKDEFVAWYVKSGAQPRRPMAQIQIDIWVAARYK